MKSDIGTTLISPELNIKAKVIGWYLFKNTRFITLLITEGKAKGGIYSVPNETLNRYYLEATELNRLLYL